VPEKRAANKDVSFISAKISYWEEAENSSSRAIEG
jgi:hypothetical protein